MKYKILVVDDAIFMRERIKKILNGIDCETIEAKNGKEGCELFQSTEPDLVLLDISMPVMNGIEALSQMICINPNIPIVMCSAIGQESQIMNAIDLGAKDFIVKPFSEDYIIGTIQKFLDK